MAESINVGGYDLPWWSVPVAIGGALGVFLLVRKGATSTPTVFTSVPADPGDGGGGGDSGAGGGVDLSALSGAIAAQAEAFQRALAGLDASAAARAKAELEAQQALAQAIINLGNRLPGASDNPTAPAPPAAPPAAAAGYSYWGQDLTNKALLLKNLATGKVESFSPDGPYPTYESRGITYKGSAAASGGGMLPTANPSQSSVPVTRTVAPTFAKPYPEYGDPA